MIAAAVVSVIAAAIFSPAYLTLRDADTGRVYARWRVVEGTEFSIEFVHSVNQTPVRDVFAVAGTDIAPVETVFYGFGAGMQTELTENQRLVYHDDGSMSITGFSQRLDALNYIVGTVSDHVLDIGGESISLRDCCGRNAAVTLKIEKNGLTWVYALSPALALGE